MMLLNVMGILLTLTFSKAEYISLNCNDWVLFSDNGWYHYNDVTVPGGVYTFLSKANIIPKDLFYSKNDAHYRYYATMDWTWSRKFQFNGETLASGKKILLIADGVDAVSNVLVNGKVVGSTDNMFVRYQFDITNVIRSGENDLEVKLVAPVSYSNSTYAKYKEQYGYSVPPHCDPDETQGDCHTNFIRKMPALYAWNWGPASPPLGVWQPIGIEIVEQPVLKDFSASVNPDGDNWAIDIDLRILKPDGSYSTHARVFLDGKDVFNSPVDLNGPDSEINSKLYRISIPKKDVELWWPNGMGTYTRQEGFKPFPRKLYNLRVTLFDSANPALNLGSVNKRIGFREVEVLQEPIRGVSDGLSFQVRVNGQLLFLKGTNLLPIGTFPDDVDVAYIHDLLTSVVKGGMNIVRAWGGGVYQPDLFYDMADEMGLLIWQDFMFSDFLYPVNQEFLQSVATEVGQQIDRLKSHPCIALWTGNNENEQALMDQWWPEVNWNPEIFKKDYVKLYMDTIYPIVSQKDPGRTYITSSPSNGIKTINEGGLDGKPTSFRYGDYHFYDFVNDPLDWTKFPGSRCVSEYGLQSHPSLETYSQVFRMDQMTWPLNWDLERRKHSDSANLLYKYVDLHFRLPQPGGQESFKKYIYLTQVLQTENVKLQSEFYLRNRYVNQTTGLGMTWGALIWQLNDAWQAPSWSTIELGGKWKMLHYSLASFFKPIHVHSYRKGDWIKVVPNNDMVNGSSIKITVDVHKYSSFGGVKMVEKSPRVGKFEAPQIFSISLENILSEGGCESENHCLIRVRYQLSTDSPSLPSSQTLGGENYLLLSPSPKSIVGLTNGNLRIGSVTKVIDNAADGVNRFKIDIQSDSVALWVWLDFKLGSGIKGTFSENGFFQFEPTKTVYFEDATGNLDESRLTNNLEVTSLFENIN